SALARVLAVNPDSSGRRHTRLSSQTWLLCRYPPTPPRADPTARLPRLALGFHRARLADQAEPEGQPLCPVIELTGTYPDPAPDQCGDADNLGPDSEINWRLLALGTIHGHVGKLA